MPNQLDGANLMGGAWMEHFSGETPIVWPVWQSSTTFLFGGHPNIHPKSCLHPNMDLSPNIAPFLNRKTGTPSVSPQRCRSTSAPCLPENPRPAASPRKPAARTRVDPCLPTEKSRAESMLFVKPVLGRSTAQHMEKVRVGHLTPHGKEWK